MKAGIIVEKLAILNNVKNIFCAWHCKSDYTIIPIDSVTDVKPMETNKQNRQD